MLLFPFLGFLVFGYCFLVIGVFPSSVFSPFPFVGLTKRIRFDKEQRKIYYNVISYIIISLGAKYLIGISGMQPVKYKNSSSMIEDSIKDLILTASLNRAISYLLKKN